MPCEKHVDHDDHEERRAPRATPPVRSSRCAFAIARARRSALLRVRSRPARGVGHHAADPGGDGDDAVGRRLGARELGRDPPVAHDEHAVRHPEHLGQFARDHDDCRAALAAARRISA